MCVFVSTAVTCNVFLYGRPCLFQRISACGERPPGLKNAPVIPTHQFHLHPCAFCATAHCIPAVLQKRRRTTNSHQHTHTHIYIPTNTFALTPKVGWIEKKLTQHLYYVIWAKALFMATNVCRWGCPSATTAKGVMRVRHAIHVQCAMCMCFVCVCITKHWALKWKTRCTDSDCPAKEEPPARRQTEKNWRKKKPVIDKRKDNLLRSLFCATLKCSVHSLDFFGLNYAILYFCFIFHFDRRQWQYVCLLLFEKYNAIMEWKIQAHWWCFVWGYYFIRNVRSNGIDVVSFSKIHPRFQSRTIEIIGYTRIAAIHIRSIKYARIYVYQLHWQWQMD